jgi:hypothetical protein
VVWWNIGWLCVRSSFQNLVWGIMPFAADAPCFLPLHRRLEFACYLLSPLGRQQASPPRVLALVRRNSGTGIRIFTCSCGLSGFTTPQLLLK